MEEGYPWWTQSIAAFVHLGNKRVLMTIECKLLATLAMKGLKCGRQKDIY